MTMQAKSIESKRENELSRFLTKVLRHQGPNMGLPIDDDGSILISVLLNHQAFRSKHYTLEEVQNVVKNNDKQRLSIIDRNGVLHIRANQGHSFEVPELELTPLTDPTQYPSVIHGTYFEALPSILKEGLSKMGRTHIHFTTGLPSDKTVISGMRRSCEVLVYLDLEAALRDNYKFYVSANNVILSPGDNKGYIPPKYFKKLVNAKTKETIPM